MRIFRTAETTTTPIKITKTKNPAPAIPPKIIGKFQKTGFRQNNQGEQPMGRSP